MKPHKIRRGGPKPWILALTVAVYWMSISTPIRAASSMALGYTPKYRPGFSHFDYVNPNAPKGGDLALAGNGSFDSLNPFLLKGIPAQGISDLVFETLMVQSMDEPYSMYAHLAQDIELARDRLSVTFRLDPRAHFSNGKPVLAQDVKFSFDTLKSKAAHPTYRIYWAELKRAVVVDARTVRFEFARVNPELHLIAAQIPVFSRDWVGTTPFDALVTTPPVGSGPYVVENYDLGKRIGFTRDPNYWARDLNTRRGMYNFGRIVFKYYKDDAIALEALKAGEFDFHSEYSSKSWARSYVGVPFASGRVRKVEVPHRNDDGMQAFVFNIRRPLFKDKRVRQAIDLAFDFEWSNRNLFYDQYTRCYSYFSNSELAATGLPQGDELKLLEPFRARLPKEVFTQEWKPPSTSPPNSLRENLRQARALLAEAGWTLKDGVLRNAKGESFEFEQLVNSIQGRTSERILLPYARNLEKLGIRMHLRTVDLSLYQRRMDTFDFDMTTVWYTQSQSPGNELIGRWHSSSANQEGSENAIGIQDPVVDALIEKVIFAPDRKSLVTATHALDRVMLYGEYVVPNWFLPKWRLAYSEKLAMPDKLPLYYQSETWMRMTWWRK